MRFCCVRNAKKKHENRILCELLLASRRELVSNRVATEYNQRDYFLNNSKTTKDLHL